MIHAHAHAHASFIAKTTKPLPDSAKVVLADQLTEPFGKIRKRRTRTQNNHHTGGELVTLEKSTPEMALNAVPDQALPPPTVTFFYHYDLNIDII